MTAPQSFTFGIATYNRGDGLQKIIFEVVGHSSDDPVLCSAPRTLADLPMGSEVTIRVIGKDYQRQERFYAGA